MRAWLVRGGAHGETEAYNLENGAAVIGWQEFPDFSGAKSKSDIEAMLRAGSPAATSAKRISNHAGQLDAFVNRIQPGDTVVMPLKTQRSVVALGKVKRGYRYVTGPQGGMHTLAVDWLQPEVPRACFRQDLLYSFGAFLTVCEISRNNALARIQAVLSGKSDPGDGLDPVAPEIDDPALSGTATDLRSAAEDQIARYIQSRFSGHDLARLIAGILEVDGYQTSLSPPGPDGGVDILAGRGPLGLEGPRLVVQVKSGSIVADTTTFRTLQGTMQTFRADLGLLVAWGGFRKTVDSEARPHHFHIRLWGQTQVIEAVFRTYDRLPEELRVELPLARTWVLVPSRSDSGE